MADKPPDEPKRDQLPWEETPHIDHKAATHKAIVAAQSRPVDPKSPAVVKWARTAFNDEIGRVREASEGNRQKILFPAAANLFEIVAAGALNETTVYDALRDACQGNHLEQDDGAKSVEDTIANARRRGFDNPRDLSRVGTKRSSNFSVTDDKRIEVVDIDEIPAIERGFWTQRESLQTIYLAALSGMCSPWAVLGCCVARVLSYIPPNCVLPPVIGGGKGGSLNWFCAVAAKSGGGKDSAMTVADDLVRVPVLVRNLGSGEGIIDQYVKPKDKETGEPQGLYESIMFNSSEADTLKTLSQRSGSMLSSTLRDAFTGTTLGFSYRSTSNLHLPKHTYRMTFIVGVQPAKAGAIMDDIYGGTLQRFMWFPASDRRVTNQPPPLQAPLGLPSSGQWQYPREIKIPYQAVELIRDEAVRRNRGETDDLEGHALFIREKFAYALAVLDGRADKVGNEDWRLAGIASQISSHTRSWVAFEMLEAQEKEMVDIGRLQGVKLNASDEERAFQVNRRLGRIAQWALRKIYENNNSMTQRDLDRAVPSRDRPYLLQALEKLESKSLLQHEGNRWIRTPQS